MSAPDNETVKKYGKERFVMINSNNKPGKEKIWRNRRLW